MNAGRSYGRTTAAFLPVGLILDVTPIAGRSNQRVTAVGIGIQAHSSADTSAERSGNPGRSPGKRTVGRSDLMTSRERVADRGRRRCRDAVRRVADDGRLARTGAGLSQEEVGRAIGSSHARIGRFERGDVEYPDLEFLGAYCAVLGLDLSLRAYPAGDPIRDRAQLALLERLRKRLHPSLRWRTEVPLPIERDLRAWDAEIRGPQSGRWRALVEAETRVADGQALERRLTLKLRDDPDGHLIL